MSLASLLRPWSGEAFRHIPASSPFGVLDLRFAGRASGNRWNEPGQPTLYLAGDDGVLIAEWGRHFEVARSRALQAASTERAVYRLTIAIDQMLDLRDPAACAALSLSDAPTCFLSVEIARATATFVRRTTAAQALLAPSVCFLDQPDRWCLVLFLEKLPSMEAVVTSVSRTGILRREL